MTLTPQKHYAQPLFKETEAIPLISDTVNALQNPSCSFSCSGKCSKLTLDMLALAIPPTLLHWMLSICLRNLIQNSQSHMSQM